MVVQNNYWVPRTLTKGKIPKLREHIKKVVAEKGEQEGVKLVRYICKEDLFYLCHEVLGYTDLVEPLHDDLCDFIETCERKRQTSVILISRGHFKSTIATVGRAIQWMIRDQNVTIGLGSADLKSAKKFLREIRNKLENCQKLKDLFPEIFYQDPRREARKWTEEEIIIKRDLTKDDPKEGTVKVFGLEDGLPTGDHYKKMLIDDSVNEDNVRTAERLAKVDQQSRYLRPLLMTPDQPINWIGTRYHIYDIYQRLIDNQVNSVYLRGAIENGIPIFPERFSLKTLELTRIELGSYIYSCQYMLQPVDPTDKKFKREWLRYFAQEIEAIYGYTFFLVVDPASRMRKSSDFTAMLVYAIDKDLNFYLVDGVHDKLNPSQRIDAVFDLVTKYSIDVVAYETIGFQETDKFFIEQRMTKENKYFKIVEITAHKQKKDDRILGLQPIMEAGKFYLPEKPIYYNRLWESPDDGKGKRVNIVEEFLAEFDFFPNAPHDDLLDASQMAREIVYSGHIGKSGDDFIGDSDYGIKAMLNSQQEKESGWE